MKRRNFLLIILLTMTAASCAGEKAEQKAASGSAGEEIVSENYNKDGIEAEYPRLISGGTQEERDRINNLIYADFNKILQIYSFNPFPELTPSPAAKVPTILNIRYVIKQNSDQIISILYRAAFNSPYSAHPTDLVYTTNIDKTNQTRLKLPDIIRINEAFVKNFRNWDFIVPEGSNEEMNKAIRDYFAGMTDEDYQLGFQNADIIGSGNLWGIYSYLTPERLGISISVPNYIGDHVEFEEEYGKLKDFLKLDLSKE